MPGADPDGASSFGADALTSALACVVVELAVQIVLLAGATQFPTDRPGWPWIVAFAALTGVHLAAIEHVRARRGHAQAHALAFMGAALALAFVASVYAGALLRFGTTSWSALDWLPRTDWWASTGLGLEVRVATLGGLVHARSRRAGPAGQRFDMALAGLVALLALSPSLPGSWWASGDDVAALVLFTLLHAALLPTTLALASRLRAAVSRRRARTAQGPRPLLRERASAALAALRQPAPVDEAVRRVERGLSRAPALVDLSWRLLALSSCLGALLLAIGAERARGEFGAWVPRVARHLGPTAVHGALLGIAAAGLLGWTVLRSGADEGAATPDARVARRRLLGAFVLLLAVSLAVWATHPRWPDPTPWELVWTAVAVGIACAGVLPPRLGLAAAGAYLVHGYLSGSAPQDLQMERVSVPRAAIGPALLLVAVALEGWTALRRSLFVGAVVGCLSVPAGVLLVVTNATWWQVNAGLSLATALALLTGPVASWAVRRGRWSGRVALAVSAVVAALTAVCVWHAGALLHAPSAVWSSWQAERGDARAMLDLARRHDVGLGAEREEALADAWYARAAEAGLPPAMHAWGQRLVAGRDTRRDVAAGADWLARAAAAGHGASR